VCIRPDICYVVPPVVWAEFRRFETGDVFLSHMEFHALCLDRIDEAEKAHDSLLVRHWQQVLDFITRHFCSPVSPVEVEGVCVYETPFKVPDEQLIRLYIANPDNPKHAHWQPDITLDSMAEINQRWLAS